MRRTVVMLACLLFVLAGITSSALAQHRGYPGGGFGGGSGGGHFGGFSSGAGSPMQFQSAGPCFSGGSSFSSGMGSSRFSGGSSFSSGMGSSRFSGAAPYSSGIGAFGSPSGTGYRSFRGGAGGYSGSVFQTHWLDLNADVAPSGSGMLTPTVMSEGSGPATGLGSRGTSRHSFLSIPGQYGGSAQGSVRGGQSLYMGSDSSRHGSLARSSWNGGGYSSWNGSFGRNSWNGGPGRSCWNNGGWYRGNNWGCDGYPGGWYGWRNGRCVWPCYPSAWCWPWYCGGCWPWWGWGWNWGWGWFSSGWPYYVYYIYDPYVYDVAPLTAGSYGATPQDYASSTGVPSLGGRKPAVNLANIADVFRNGDVAGAEALLDQAAQQYPNDAQINYILAYVRVLQDKYDEAVTALRRGIAADDRMPNMGSVILNGFFDTNQAKNALRRLNDMMKDRPDDTIALLRVYMQLLTSQS